MARRFGVETIHLDLPPLAGALSRRLRDAGVPVTPERAASSLSALTLVRPGQAPAAVLDRPGGVRVRPVQVTAFDAVFFSVFGGAARRPDPDGRARTAPAPPDGGIGRGGAGAVSCPAPPGGEEAAS